MREQRRSAEQSIRAEERNVLAKLEEEIQNENSLIVAALVWEVAGIITAKFPLVSALT